jgi:hypothetical protein
MPRPIHVPSGQPGITTYTLSAGEEFSVLAVTFSLVPLAGAGADNFAYLDMRDPAGGIIYLQPLSPGDGANMFYSLAVDAEPFTTENYTPPYWPQDSTDVGFAYVSQRLSPQTLYTGCTLNVYKTVGSEQPPTDPITDVSTHYTIPDLHLWVADVGVSDYKPPPPLPPILVHAPEMV